VSTTPAKDCSTVSTSKAVQMFIIIIYPPVKTSVPAVAADLSVAYVPTVAGLLALAGVPAVAGFSAVVGVSAVDSIVDTSHFLQLKLLTLKIIF